MVRRSMSAVVALCALTVAPAAVPGAVAGAEPVGAGAAACDWRLSGPMLVDVSGTTMVTATVTPGECTGEALPKEVVACVATATDAGRCRREPGYKVAQVYYAPYLPGVNYVASGRGCASPHAPAPPACTSLGPTSAVL